MKPRLFTIFLLLTLLMLLMGTIHLQTTAMAPAAVSTGTTTRVSVASNGTQGNDESRWPSISADGRYVAFNSIASNLVPGDTNGYADIFVHDRQTGQIIRVSVASDGMQANERSGGASISADGRYVAFSSEASNLVPGDTNGWSDMFVHDRHTGQTSRVSLASDGTQGNIGSTGPSISADGRYVAFTSGANNLVPGDTNHSVDVFVHNRQTGQTSRVSVASGGTQANSFSDSASISADGRYVAFRSSASNLVPNDTNGWSDIFVHDRQTGETSRVSVASNGTQGNYWSWNPSISADGRYVAFESFSDNLVPDDTNGYFDVFVHDRQTGETSRISVASDGTQGNNDSQQRVSISADGRYVAFVSSASNLVPGDTNGYEDIFIHDRYMGQTSRASMDSDGTQANGSSAFPSISADGRYLAFVSAADNLVPGDTNEVSDVFVHERAVALPSLSINYPDGQPGSFFTVTGSNFPPNSTAAVVINGVTLTTTLPVDSSGGFLFLLNTEQADAGHYFVTVTANPEATVSFILDPAAPLRPQVDSGAIFQVPDGIALTEFIYLPLIQR
jgi:Tol biopolymer transport system component